MSEYEYEQFLASKRVVAEAAGIEVSPDAVNPLLYDFQGDITILALKRGRSAAFLDCGTGKTFIQLEWERLIGGLGLIVAPLCVGSQTVSEALKLGIEVRQVRHPSELSESGIHITNYEMLDKFVGVPFKAFVLDESSILKSLDGATRNLLLEEFTSIPYRLCCTATPCPNDIAELANHSEFLGIMSRSEMLASFFVHDDEGWRLRGHAEKPFYRWMASWATFLKNPADLGYDGSKFVLPALTIKDSVVSYNGHHPGRLFADKLHGITDRAKVREATKEARVERVAELAWAAEGQVIVWCGLNSESKLCADTLPDSHELTGSQSSEQKEAIIRDFVAGKFKTLITKMKIAGFGMNFQNASTQIYCGLGDSWESYYQGIRRSWRYGQTKPVNVHIVVSELETAIIDNVRQKEKQAEEVSRLTMEGAREFELMELKGSQLQEQITEDEFHGEGWALYQGDCVKRSRELGDNSIDLSVFSPPFISLFTYSASEADMGNSSTPRQFFKHYSFLIKELLRITKPGRIAAVHVAQVPTTLVKDGVIGLRDFRGDSIRAFTRRGWVYHGEAVVRKNPQAQAIRVHAKGLSFGQLHKDSSWMRPCMLDFVLFFRKPGDNEVEVIPEIDNNTWIDWADGIWREIDETDTLNVAEARENKDDRHICALQLGLIERCVRLWSNPGETVFSPFAGIGSEGFVSLEKGRKFIGIELKPMYAKVAAKNLDRATKQQGLLAECEAITI